MSKKGNNEFKKDSSIDEDIEEQLKTKKEKRKEDRETGKKYLKAQYNYRLGYRFKALNKYLKLKLKYFYTHYHKYVIFLLILTLLVSLIISAANIIQGISYNPDIKKYHKKYEDLQSHAEELNQTSKKNFQIISDKSVSNQTGVIRGKKTIDKIINGMYDYDSAETYDNNRSQNMEYFEKPNSKEIQSIYSNAKDSNGNNQIETLGLTSKVNDIQIFTAKPEDTKKKIIPFKVVASYTGYIKDVSSEFSSRNHYTTYQVDYDTSSNKITKMKKLNSVKINNEIN